MIPPSFWRAVALVLAASLCLGLPAAQAETKYAHTTFDGLQAGFFSDEITGALSGNRYFGYRFKSDATGVVYYVQVGVRGAGTTESTRVKVCLYADANFRLGSKLKSWDLTAVRGGAFRFPIIYNSDAGIELRKGFGYWLTIEPADDDTWVEWLNGADKYPAETVRFSKDGFAYSHDSDTPLQPAGASTVAVETAYQAALAPQDSILKVGNTVLNEDGKTIGSIGAVAQLPLKGVILEGRKLTPAIFAADGSVKLRVGGEAPGLSGSKIAALGEPCGDAVLATLAVGPASVKRTDAQVLIAGLRGGTMRIAARQGVPLTSPADTSIKSFGSIDANGSAIFFTAKLSFTGVTARKDDALLVALGDGSVRALVQEGQTIGTASVSTISTLVPAAGSPAEGRWRAADDKIGVKLSFAANKAPQQSSSFPQPRLAHRIGSPAPQSATSCPPRSSTRRSPRSARPPFTMAAWSTPPRSRSARAEWCAARRRCSCATPLASSRSSRKSARHWSMPPAPRSRASIFAAIKDPVCGANGTVAFIATGTRAASGVFFLDGTNPLRSVALAGGSASGGSHFASFVSLILPNATGAGPVFTAKLKPDPIVSVSLRTTDGLWASTDAGLALLIREGAAITFDGGSTHVTAFTALGGGAGSLGADRGLDANGNVLVLGSFLSDDKRHTSRALVALPIPTGM